MLYGTLFLPHFINIFFSKLLMALYFLHIPTLAATQFLFFLQSCGHKCISLASPCEHSCHFRFYFTGLSSLLGQILSTWPLHQHKVWPWTLWKGEDTNIYFVVVTWSLLGYLCMWRILWEKSEPWYIWPTKFCPKSIEVHLFNAI